MGRMRVSRCAEERGIGVWARRIEDVRERGTLWSHDVYLSLDYVARDQPMAAAVARASMSRRAVVSRTGLRGRIREKAGQRRRIEEVPKWESSGRHLMDGTGVDGGDVTNVTVQSTLVYSTGPGWDQLRRGSHCG